MYGVPVIVSFPSLPSLAFPDKHLVSQNIPVSITCLQRLDSIILSLGTTLLVAWAYLRSPISLTSSDARDSIHTPKTNTVFWVTFPMVCLIHMGLAVLFTPPVLTRIGIHTAAYTSLLVALGLLFGGLAVWDVLT